MAEKKCGICGEIFDDSLNVCPKCGAESEKIDDVENDKITEAPDNADDKNENDNVLSEEVAEDSNSESDNIEDPDRYLSGEIVFDEYGNPSEAVPESKTDKKLLSVAIALGVVIVGLIAFIIIGKMNVTNVAPKTISVSKFEKNDIAGLYKDANAGFTFEFTAKETDVTISSEDSDTSDSQADSAADSSAEKKENKKTEKHDGTFVGKYDKSFIETQIIKEYISANDKQDDYKKYLEDKKLEDDDYKGYVKEKKLDSEVKKYDEEQSITKTIEGYVTNGTWKYDEDGKVIKMYDESGSSIDELYVTENGLIESMMYFKGEITKKTSTLVYKYDEQNIVQTLKLYENGDCNVSVSQDGKEVQSISGTYKIKGDKLVLTIQDSDTKFVIVDGGVAMCVYNK